MADNTDLSAAVGSGDKIVTREISHGGDTAKLQGVFAMGVSGTEGSYTAAAIGGDATNGLDVDVTRSALPTGAATSAKQDTAQTALDAIQAAVEGTLTVDASGTVAVTNGGLTELAAAINASSQLDVNIAASSATLTVASHAVTNAGTFAVQAAQSGTWTVQIGNTANTTPILASIHDGTTKASVADLTNSNPLHVALVDTNGDQISSFGGGTQYTEDAAAAANPVGTAVMLVRDDTPGALVSADGDNVAQRGTNFGAAFVQVVDSSGNFIDTFGGSGGTAAADDADFTATSTQGTPVMGVYESSPTSVTDGDMGVVGITADREIKVAVTSGGVAGIVDDAAFTAGTSEGVLLMGVASSDTVDSGDAGAVAMTTARELKVSLTTALPAGTAAIGKLAANSGVDIGDVDVTSVPADPFGANADAASATGSISAKLRFIASTGIPITGTVTVGSHAVTNAGTFAVQESGSALTALQLIDDPVFADDAAYTLSTSKAQVIAGIAVETDGTDPGTVSAEGDAAALRTDRARRLLVSQHHPRGFFVSADYGIAQSNASVKAAPGSGLKLYITDIVISNGATAGNVTLLDGSGGTVLFECYPAINGGVSISLKQPIVLTANTALCITSTTVTTHSVNIGGYIAP